MQLVGPLRPIASFTLAALAALSVSRAALVALYWTRVRDVPGSWWTFPIGLRLDAMTLGWLLLPVATLVVAWPRRPGAVLAWIATTYLVLVASVLAFVETATYPFLAEYDGRPNRIFLDYLAYPHEVLGTVWADHKLALLVALAIIVTVGRRVARLRQGFVDGGTAWRWPGRVVVGPVALIALFLVARSGLGPRGGNISTAAFTSDHLVNELALDSTYALGYALDSRLVDEMDPGPLYGWLPRQEAIRRVRAGMLLPPSAFPRDDVPFLHHQTSATPRDRPYNLVVFLQESLGAEYVGTLGGMPLTPCFDALAAEGLLFTNLYATGTRTVRGIEATVAGFPPTPASSVVKLGLAQGGFFTLAELLRRQGYATEFVYGGQSSFDNMRGFLLNDGFERVIDERAFRAPAFRGVWGVSDEDLVRRANDTFAAHGDRPFFALMLSTSNHPPFEYPAGRIALFEEPAATVHNAMKYADFAIGEFFRLAKREAYFRHTVFLVVADHNTRVYGQDLVPIKRFHIPALILGPDVAPGRDDGLASQIDLAPTLLDLIGLDADTPLMGRDLVQVPPGVPGRALMQYDLANGYRVGDDVIVHEPYRQPRQFRYEDGRLRPVALDPELARDALAHIEVPAFLYHERRYRLPETSAH